MTKVKKSWVGTQKILQEEQIGNIVKVTLETNQEEYPGIGETEVVEFEKSVLDYIRTDKPNNDATQLRTDSAYKTISEILIVLMNNCVKIDDIKYIFENVLYSIQVAEQIKDRKLRGITEGNWNVQQLKDELLKK